MTDPKYTATIRIQGLPIPDDMGACQDVNFLPDNKVSVGFRMPVSGNNLMLSFLQFYNETVSGPEMLAYRMGIIDIIEHTDRGDVFVATVELNGLTPAVNNPTAHNFGYAFETLFFQYDEAVLERYDQHGGPLAEYQPLVPFLHEVDASDYLTVLSNTRDRRASGIEELAVRIGTVNHERIAQLNQLPQKASLGFVADLNLEPVESFPSWDEPVDPLAGFAEAFAQRVADIVQTRLRESGVV